MSGTEPSAQEKVYVQRAQPGDADAINGAVARLFALLPATKRLGPESKVLIKPNLLSKHAPERAVTTHPHVLRAVMLALYERGVRHITVADSPGGPYNPGVMQALYQGCGIAAVCQELGAEMYTACQSAPRKTDGRLVHSFTLIEPVHQCDFIVNLAKLKSHVLTGLSGAVKNQFGCVPGLEKAEFHMRFPQKEQFGQMLVDLSETVHSDIHIVDGIIGMEGDGPAGGSPREFGLLLAGQNPYTVDLALCHFLSMKPMDTPVLRAAHQSGLCAETLPAGVLQGEEEALRPIQNFKQPASYEGPVNFSQKFPPFMRPLINALAERNAPRPVVRPEACIGCARCAGICPKHVISMATGKAFIKRQGCIRCFCCHEICPVKAIDIHRGALFRWLG